MLAVCYLLFPIYHWVAVRLYMSWHLFGLQHLFHKFIRKGYDVNAVGIMADRETRVLFAAPLPQVHT